MPHKLIEVPHRAGVLGSSLKTYFTRSAPALQAAASWSPVPPLQPTAPISLPPSISGQPPGEAMSVVSSVDT